MISCQIGKAATAPVWFDANRLFLIEADPDAHGDVRIETNEPRVRVVVGRAGLAGERPVEYLWRPARCRAE